MEETYIQRLIYIIAAVIIIIANLVIRSRSKKMASKKAATGKAATAEMHEEYPAQKTKHEESHFPSVEEAESLETIISEIDESKKPHELLSGKLKISTMKAMKFTKLRGQSDKEEVSIKKGLKIKLTHEELKKAIIYSEIITPKHF